MDIRDNGKLKDKILKANKKSIRMLQLIKPRIMQ